jgi:hypothetical protein
VKAFTLEQLRLVWEPPPKPERRIRLDGILLFVRRR